jgi:hypothetical protein
VASPATVVLLAQLHLAIANHTTMATMPLAMKSGIYMKSCKYQFYEFL